MKLFKQYAETVRDGYDTHATILEIMKKYGKACEEGFDELTEVGITPESFRRLSLIEDRSIEGILYSIGGTASWVRHGFSKGCPTFI